MQFAMSSREKLQVRNTQSTATARQLMSIPAGDYTIIPERKKYFDLILCVSCDEEC